VTAQEDEVSEEFLNNWITKIHERYNPELVTPSNEVKTQQKYQFTTNKPPKKFMYQTTTYSPLPVYPKATTKPIVYKPIAPPVYPKATTKPIVYKPIAYPRPTSKPIVYKPISYPVTASKPIVYRPPAYPQTTPHPIVYETPKYKVATYKPPTYHPTPKPFHEPSYRPKVIFEKPIAYKPAQKPSYTAAPTYAKEYAYDGKANYKYEYAVVDEYSGLNFGASESREGYVTQGEYRVLLPDCRTQVVRYNTADAYSGNVAEVTYEGTPCYNNSYKNHS
jgi:hypothetical protein